MRFTTVLRFVLATAFCITFSIVSAQDGGVESLRGEQSLSEANKVPQLKKWQHDRAPIPRDYVQQPPLVPHSIDHYQITKDNNKCLTCHSWTRYKETGATKISLTHFKDRDGAELANVAPRRYFCTQCHVPQVDALPLVENKFQPIRAVIQDK